MCIYDAEDDEQGISAKDPETVYALARDIW
jgi:hypothetical protein